MRAIEKRRIDYAPSGGTFELTDKRLEIMDLLQDYRYLPVPYIAKLLGYTRSVYTVRGKEIVRYVSLQEHLHILRTELGLLCCPGVDMSRFNTYALTEKGDKELKDRGRWREIPRVKEPYDDVLGISMTRASFQIGCQENGFYIITTPDVINHPACPLATKLAPSITFPVSFDYPTKHKTYPISMDIRHDYTPFGIAHPQEDGTRTTIMIPGMEFDKDTEGFEVEDPKAASVKKHFLATLAAGRSGVYRSKLGIPNWFVPYIFVGKPRMEAAMRLLEKLTHGKGAKFIGFGWVPPFHKDADYPPATSWAMTWQRVGYDEDGPFGPFDFVQELQ